MKQEQIAGQQEYEKSGRCRGAQTEDDFARVSREAFARFVEDAEFPCVGGKAAFNSASQIFGNYGALSSTTATAELCRDLYRFAQSGIRHESEYATFIAIFSSPLRTDEPTFERAFWRQLQQLNATDAQSFAWNPLVQSDPGDPHFSFSFAGQAFYVIGMHANSSRLARRFDWPVLVFNPHEQFERLRADGNWKRMQQTIRVRDVRLQGSINPMLSDFGEASEARQYSGRAVDADWQPPFRAVNDARAPAAAKPGKCPFGH